MVELTRYARQLKEGIFDQGRRLTAKGWAMDIFGSDDIFAVTRIYNLVPKLTLAGYPVIPISQTTPRTAGVYYPLTESRDIARVANKRIGTKIDQSLVKYDIYITKELEVFPDMRSEIRESLSETAKTLTSIKKKVEL